MWPSGHLAFAYLWIRLVTLSRERPIPHGSEVVFLALGGLFPDLVDKPFAWTIPILPSGRSLAHSLIAFGVIAAILLGLLRQERRRHSQDAFLLGYLSHIVADALPALITLDLRGLSFLDWPIPPHPLYENDSGFVSHYLQLRIRFTELLSGEIGESWYLAFQLVLVTVMAIVWIRDGFPGVGFVARKLGLGKS